MGTLRETATADHREFDVDCEADAALVCRRLDEMAGHVSMSSDVTARAMLVASSLVAFLLHRAGGGELVLRTIERAVGGRTGAARGFEITSIDRGRRHLDVRSALREADALAGEPAGELAGVRHSALEVDIDVRDEEGARIRARVFEEGTPKGHEIGIYGRPYPGEAVSGDHAAFWRAPEVLFSAVCDGVGHGPAARAVAERAVAAAEGTDAGDPASLLERSHQALDHERGAAMAVARINERSRTVAVASVGNVSTKRLGGRPAHGFHGSPGVLGARRHLRLVSETADFDATNLLVVTTDGVESRITSEPELAGLVREHPAVLAYELVSRCGSPTDDALALVAS
jgi:hypothetical protein